MIVRLTHNQGMAVIRRVSGFHGHQLREHRRKAGRTSHDYELPAIGWRQILDELSASCFGPVGGKLENGVPKSAYSAVKRIATSVMLIENHPALHRRAASGWLGEMLPVFIRGNGASPYPPGVRFNVLWPHHDKVNGMAVTIWRPLNGADLSETHPDTQSAWHLEFLGRSAAPDADTIQMKPGPDPRPESWRQ